MKALIKVTYGSEVFRKGCGERTHGQTQDYACSTQPIQTISDIWAITYSESFPFQFVAQSRDDLLGKQSTSNWLVFCAPIRSPPEGISNLSGQALSFSIEMGSFHNCVASFVLFSFFPSLGETTTLCNNRARKLCLRPMAYVLSLSLSLARARPKIHPSISVICFLTKLCSFRCLWVGDECKWTCGNQGQCTSVSNKLCTLATPCGNMNTTFIC